MVLGDISVSVADDFDAEDLAAGMGLSEAPEYVQDLNKDEKLCKKLCGTADKCKVTENVDTKNKRFICKNKKTIYTDKNGNIIQNPDEQSAEPESPKAENPIARNENTKSPEYCATKVYCLTNIFWSGDGEASLCNANDDLLESVAKQSVSTYKTPGQTDEQNKNDYQVGVISDICGAEIAQQYKKDLDDPKSNESSNKSDKNIDTVALAKQNPEKCKTDVTNAASAIWNKQAVNSHPNAYEQKVCTILPDLYMTEDDYITECLKQVCGDEIANTNKNESELSEEQQKLISELKSDIQIVVDAFNNKKAELEKTGKK